MTAFCNDAKLAKVREETNHGLEKVTTVNKLKQFANPAEEKKNSASWKNTLNNFLVI